MSHNMSFSLLCFNPLVIVPIFIFPFCHSSFTCVLYEFMNSLLYVYVEDVCAQRLIVLNSLNILWGVHTFSLPRISLWLFGDSAHSTAHIQIVQATKAS